MREQIVIKLPKHIGEWIQKGVIKSFTLKGDRRDIIVKIVDYKDMTDEIEIETG